MPRFFQSSLVLRNMVCLIHALHHLSNNFINHPYLYELSLPPKVLSSIGQYSTNIYTKCVNKVLSLGDGTDFTIFSDHSDFIFIPFSCLPPSIHGRFPSQTIQILYLLFFRYLHPSMYCRLLFKPFRFY